MPRTYTRKLGARRYKDYSDEKLNACIEAVNCGLSVSEAVKNFGIPRKTIFNKMKQRHSKKPGRPEVFSAVEEKLFCDCVIAMSEYGFPLDEFDLRNIIKSYLDRIGREVDRFKKRNNMPGPEWTKKFLSRHKELTVRFAANIKRARAAINEETLSNYINNLEKSLDGIPPENIYNYDETNLTDDPGSKKVLTKRGIKYPEKIMNTSKSSTSIMMCGNAAGELVPPFVVYKSKHLWYTWTVGGPTGARYSNSLSGWFNAETFTEWFVKTMLPILKKKAGKKALIGDNLSSHVNDNVLQLCREHNIQFICLPPNSTHITQPLDVSFFRPLKISWRKILRDYKENTPGRSSTTVQKNHFPTLLKELMAAMEKENRGQSALKAGFAKCGIYPCKSDPLLKRLPGRKEQEDETEARKDFKDFLAEKRSELVLPKQKKKKIVSLPEPGTSLAEEEDPCLKLTDQSTGTDIQEIVENLGDSSGGEDFIGDQSDDGEPEHEEQGQLQKTPLQPEQKVEGTWVAFQYDKNTYPGKITAATDDSVEISAMEKTAKAWRWPKKPDILPYEWNDIICVIKEPTAVNKRGYFQVPELN